MGFGSGPEPVALYPVKGGPEDTVNFQMWTLEISCSIQVRSRVMKAAMNMKESGAPITLKSMCPTP